MSRVLTVNVQQAQLKCRKLVLLTTMRNKSADMNPTGLNPMANISSLTLPHTCQTCTRCFTYYTFMPRNSPVSLMLSPAPIYRLGNMFIEVKKLQNLNVFLSIQLCSAGLLRMGRGNVDSALGPFSIAPKGTFPGQEPACQRRRCKCHGFSPWVGKIPWRRQWQPTQVLLPGESHGHGQRSLVG